MYATYLCTRCNQQISIKEPEVTIRTMMCGRNIRGRRFGKEYSHPGCIIKPGEYIKFVRISTTGDQPDKEAVIVFEDEI